MVLGDTAFERGLGHDGRTLIIGISALIKEISERAIFYPFSQLRSHPEDGHL